MPHVGNPTGHMTISIGATAISSEHWISVDAAYKRADDALYEAKTSGRDRTVVLPPAAAWPALEHLRS